MSLEKWLRRELEFHRKQEDKEIVNNCIEKYLYQSDEINAEKLDNFLRDNEIKRILFDTKIAFCCSRLIEKMKYLFTEEELINMFKDYVIKMSSHDTDAELALYNREFYNTIHNTLKDWDISVQNLSLKVKLDTCYMKHLKEIDYIPFFIKLGIIYGLVYNRLNALDGLNREELISIVGQEIFDDSLVREDVVLAPYMPYADKSFNGLYVRIIINTYLGLSNLLIKQKTYQKIKNPNDSNILLFEDSETMNKLVSSVDNKYLLFMDCLSDDVIEFLASDIGIALIKQKYANRFSDSIKDCVDDIAKDSVIEKVLLNSAIIKSVGIKGLK